MKSPGLKKAGRPGARRAAAVLTASLLAGACVPSTAELIVANGPDARTLDPHQATGAPEGRILRALYSGLTRLDPVTLRPEPDLAESWTVSDDGLEWRFTLREDLAWSDGSPITADDFVASWLRLLDPRTGASYSGWLEAVAGAPAWLAWPSGAEQPPPPAGLEADGRQLLVRLTRPLPFFAEMCAWHVLAPVAPMLREALPGESPPAIPTCGPFRLAWRRIRDRVRVERNPHYWNAQKVELESIDFLTVESQFTALNLFLAGQAHYLADVPGLAIPALLRREEERAAVAREAGRPPPAPEFAPSPFLATYFYRFNTTRPPFDDARVRRALCMAVDRRELVKVLGAGQPPAWSFTPPWLDGYQPPAGPGFDLEEARRLLAAAGYPDGAGLRRLEILFNSGEVHRDVAEVLQDQWRRLGVQCSLANQEFKILLEHQSRLDYDLSRSSWIADYLDPESFLEVFRSSGGDNRTGWRDAAYDAELDRARLEADPVQRRQALRRAEARLLHEAPILPLFYYLGLDLVSPRLRGFARNLRGYVDWSRLSLTPEG